MFLYSRSKGPLKKDQNLEILTLKVVISIGKYLGCIFTLRGGLLSVFTGDVFNVPVDKTRHLFFRAPSAQNNPLMLILARGSTVCSDPGRRPIN